MKLRRKVGQIIAVVGGAILLPGLIIPIVTEQFNAVSITLIAVGLALPLLGMYLIRRPSLSRILYERRNMRKPAPGQIDYAKEIDAVRKNYQKETAPLKNALPREIVYDPELFDESVWENGSIYYGALVQANDILFRSSYKEAVLPGVVLFGIDTYFDEHPEKLLLKAHELYENKSGNMLRFETVYKKFEPVGEIDGRPVYVSTVMFYREHFPVCELRGNVFPIIAKEGCPAVYMLNSKYWTDNLIGDYMLGSYNANKLIDDESRPQS